MKPADLKKILTLRETVIRRCEERIEEARSEVPCRKKTEPSEEETGFTRMLRKKHGL